MGNMSLDKDIVNPFNLTLETPEEITNCDEISLSKGETGSSKLDFDFNLNSLYKTYANENIDVRVDSTPKSTQFSFKGSKYETKSRFSRFLNRILPRRKRKNECGIHNQISSDEVYLCDYKYDLNTCFKANEKNIYKMASNPISSIFDKPLMTEYRNSEALKEIIDFGTRIENSEVLVKELIIKFIQDKSCENELLLALSNHKRLLMESEKRALNLASESWLQQTKLHKEQQDNLQNTLNNIVHDNRVLLEENEILSNNNEKLNATIAFLKESSFEPKTPKIFTSCVLDDMSKHNEKLRNKVSSITHEMKSLEETIRKYQKRNNFLEHQLTNTNSQLQKQKSLFDKSKTENEVQVAKLLFELQKSASTIKECTDAGSIIIEDLNIIEKNLQPFAQKINWDKFKGSGITLLDLLHQSRWCLNELNGELNFQQSKLNESQKELSNLKNTVDSLTPLQQDVINLEKKLEQAKIEGKSFEVAKIRYEEQLGKYREKITLLEKCIVAKDDDLLIKEKLIREKDEEIGKLTKTVTSMKADLKKLQTVAEKIVDENHKLQMQLKSMVQVVTATGSGDIAKELANTQQQLIHIQAQYFAIAAENNIMLKEIESSKSEHKTLAGFQNSCYEQFQVLKSDIDLKDKNLEALKEQLETEKQTVSALQAERVRHLEERTVLTAIYERLKAEISKVDQLEGTVSTMNKKASKLAMIAEYNKQLGEKLQMEVAERDVAINELQNNVKELNDFQIHTTKEKVALCEELNKVFSVKEVLNTKLAAELEKNVLLDETKKEIKINANLQLKEIQAVYNKEHSAMKNLIADLKRIATERDALLESNKKLEQKCSSLTIERDSLSDLINKSNQLNQLNEKKMCTLESILEKHSFDLQEAKNEKNEINSLNETIEELTTERDEMLKDNEKLRSVLKEAQQELEKIKQDLAQAKKSKETFKSTCGELAERNEKLLRQLEVKSKKIENMEMENSDMRLSMSSINDKFKCISEENERFSQETLRLESIISDKFQTNKHSGETTPKFVENTLDDINARDEEILDLQEKIRDLESQVMEFNDLIQSVSKNRDELCTANGNLEKEVAQLTRECENYQERILKLESFLDSMELKNIKVIELEHERSLFLNEMNLVKTEFKEKISELGEQLKVADFKYSEDQTTLSQTKLELESTKECKINLEKAHRQMALKLLTAIRFLIAEKVASDKMQDKLKEFQEENERLLEELETKNREIFYCESQIKEYRVSEEKLKSKMSDLNSELAVTHKTIADLKAQIGNSVESDSQMEISLKCRIKEQENQIFSLKSQIDNTHKEMESLQTKVDNLESTCATLEFEKSEALLRFHELQAKIQAEQARNEELQNDKQHILSTILRMKGDGLINGNAHADLLLALRDAF